VSDALKYQISVMQAALEGKQIQIRTSSKDEWEDNDAPLWNWYSYYYRVKPEEVSIVIARSKTTRKLVPFREDIWDASPYNIHFDELKRVKVTL
jgi:hypothetical protein